MGQDLKREEEVPMASRDWNNADKGAESEGEDERSLLRVARRWDRCGFRVINLMPAGSPELGNQLACSSSLPGGSCILLHLCKGWRRELVPAGAAGFGLCTCALLRRDNQGAAGECARGPSCGYSGSNMD